MKNSGVHLPTLLKDATCLACSYFPHMVFLMQLRLDQIHGKKIFLGSIMFSNRRVHRPILSLRELLTHVDERGSLICFLLFKYI
jgi:hypothetical protein